MKFFRFLMLCFGILVLLEGLSLAGTFYVATNGDDSRSCSTAQNISTPKRTIPSALGCVAPGDTLYIRSGSYPGINSHDTIIPTGSSWTNAPLIAVYPGETVTLTSGTNIVAPSNKGQSEIKYIVFDGFKFEASSGDALALGGNVHHVRIKNCEAYGAPAGEHMGINMQPKIGYGAPSYNEIINCKVHDNGVDGEQAHGLYIAGNYNLFDRIESYNNADRGIQIYSEKMTPTGNIIRNSIFRNNGGGSKPGVGITAYGTDNLIYNNLSYNNGYGIGLQGSNHRVYNNTVYNNANVGIESGASGVVVRNNIAYSNGTNISGSMTQDHNLTTNPVFVDPANRNFSLQSGSPAINAGQTVSEITTDFAGTPRPQGSSYDIGAYEYGNTQTTMPPPSNLIVQQ